jgi:hypothetical protein
VESFAPALAVLAAMGLRFLWRLSLTQPWLWMLVVAALGAYAVVASLPYDAFFIGMLAAGALLALAVTTQVLAIARLLDLRVPGVVGTLGLLLCLFSPSAWIAVSASRGGQITNPNPVFYAGATNAPDARQVPVEQALAWTSVSSSTRYVLAIDGFNNAAEVVAISGAAVLPFWNEYLGQSLFSREELADLINNHEVRYFLASTQRLSTFLGDYLRWLQSQCTNESRAASMPRGWTLWDCGQES